MENFQITTIKDALAQEPDSLLNLTAKVIKTGSVTSYTKKDNTKMSYFPCLVADTTGSAWLRVYQVYKLTTYAPETTLMLKGVLRKTGEHPFWCHSATKVTNWINIDIPQDVLDAAEHTPQQMGSPVRSLSAAIVATSPSTVVGKVAQTSPLKLLKNGKLPTRFLRLVDETDSAPVKIALFGKEAEDNYSAGDVIKVTETYPYKKGLSLSTKKQAKVEFLPSDHLNVNITDIAMSPDRDFEQDIDTTEEFEVMGIQSVYTYQCCDKPGCRNKKIRDGKCPSCEENPVQEEYYCSATIIIRRGSNFSQIKMFFDNLQKLFTLPDKRDDYTTILLEIKAQLPVTARAKFSRSGVEILTVKRPHTTST